MKGIRVSLAPLERREGRALLIGIWVLGGYAGMAAALALPESAHSNAVRPAVVAAAEAVAVAEDVAGPSLNTPVPTSWMPTRNHTGSCRRTQPRCHNARRTPRPEGADAERAEALGLGTVRAAHLAMSGNIPDAWKEAVEGTAVDSLRWPVDGGRFGRGFGFVRRERRNLPHEGVDVAAPAGSLIRAANDGLVIYSDDQVRGYGNFVVLLHADGSSTYYAHCRANYVFAGQRVLRGQSIGEVGATGLAQGAHLHFEWRVRGRARSPERRFVREAAIAVDERDLVASR